MFCNAWKQYGDYPQVRLPDGRTELALGDLVSGEERYVVLMLEVLPLPLLPDGSLPASLEGEELDPGPRDGFPRAEEHALRSALLWTDQQREAVHRFTPEIRIHRKKEF
jgi:hypothetical protein